MRKDLAKPHRWHSEVGGHTHLIDNGGTYGQVAVQEWPNEQASWLALLAHVYGEHIGRYAQVAAALQAAGATVVGPDHEGHGRSEGQRAVITDFEDVVDDLHAVAERTAARYADPAGVVIAKLPCTKMENRRKAWQPPGHSWAFTDTLLCFAVVRRQ